MKKKSPKGKPSPKKSTPKHKSLIDFGRGLLRAKDAAALIELRLPDFVRLAVSRCVADIPLDLGASAAADRAFQLFKAKIENATKRKFDALDFKWPWLQEALKKITLTEEEWTSPPRRNNTIQTGAQNPILPRHGLYFSESDTFPEKWYDLLGSLKSKRSDNRENETSLLFPIIFRVAMGDFLVRENWSNETTRDEAKGLIQTVLRQHTIRVFQALKRQYQAMPVLLEKIEKLGPMPSSLEIRRKNDPFALQAYLDWRGQPWNAAQNFEGWETFLDLPTLVPEDLVDNENSDMC